jgi:hypothetical protein
VNQEAANTDSLSRHCERSEAIHLTTERKNGLLRCARNDGSSGSHKMKWPLEKSSGRSRKK